MSNLTTATQRREEGKPEVVSLEPEARTYTSCCTASTEGLIHSFTNLSYPPLLPGSEPMTVKGILRPLCRSSQTISEGRLNLIHSIIHKFNNLVLRTYYVAAPCSMLGKRAFRHGP